MFNFFILLVKILKSYYLLKYLVFVKVMEIFHWHP